MISINRRAGWLAAVALSVAMFAGSVPAFAQEISPDQLALARKYVDLTDKVDVYGTTVANVAARTLQQILRLNPNLQQQATDAVTEVVKTYKDQRSTLMDQVARIYAQHFTQDEMQQIVNFYSSPAGQKLASQNFAINQELQKVMALFQVNVATEFYAKVRADLKTKGVTL
ncbi:MAG TPA: DUF2059 domain-containing protein [Devosiaceae bacterium]|jgi:hypothetical protein|nr:DUF2059 domain-containing protein [Devosiaceae bacterium]